VIALAPYLSHWRTTTVRDREVVEAVVRPEHLPPSPALHRALGEWPGTYYWATGPDAGRLVLVRALAPAPRERWWLHTLLFLVTFLTVQLGGALLFGERPHTLPTLSGGIGTLGAHIVAWLRGSLVGLPFAMALMAILLAHEMGHYLTAKRYGINASPPYFIPAPIEVNFIGTFGAFIRLRSPIVDRRQLLDVGAAGPWLGFAVALLMLAVGLQRSVMMAPGSFPGPMVLEYAWGGHHLMLGDSVITWALRHLLLGEGTAVLHPLAAAGWFGVLVTALNLLPLGQLDGSHVVYALLGHRQRHVALLTLAGLALLGAWYRPWWLMPWWIIAVLAVLMSGGRLAHPRVLETVRPLPPGRVPIAWATVLLFLLTFTPIPITA
jgi:membrane-associated protease RseP (regulator of RpoE activity)